MTDSSSGSGIPSAADLMGGSSLMGHREIKFPSEKGEVTRLGGDLAQHAPTLGNISKATGSIEVGFPGFGAIGLGLASAHDNARKAAAKALEEAQKALASWEKALKDMDENYDRTNPDPPKNPNPAGPGGPQVPGPGDLGKGPKVPNPDDLGKGPKVPNPDDLGKGPKVPNPDDLGKGPSGGPDLGNAGPGTGGPTDPSLNRPDLGLGTDLPSHDTTGITTPSIGDPNTRLAGLDPNGATIPGGQYPGGGGSGWPGAGSGGTTTGGSGYSGTASGAGPGRTAADAARGAGAGGTGMPYMPPMGGNAAGAQEREREKPGFLTGDEGDWGADDDVAPPVIGQIG
ncbi:hypothetical protein [Microtetraspora fusca]|uniref:hypothetical protein n=1 Tax=Microtetraspora fusca TaxID=1997 RepID=UPI00083698F5|nr:hypothetical protein [Microtetraspora fusca]